MENLRLMILPAVTLGWGLAGVLMRQVQSYMLEVLQQEYVITAWAKAVDLILYRDFPVVQAVTLVLAVGVLLTNLVADIRYSVVDPRIAQ